LPQLRGTHTRGREEEAIETQTLEPEAAEDRHGDIQPLILLLRLHGERVTDRSYTVKAVEALPRLGEAFTVSQLSRAAGIPRSKGYPTLRRLLGLRVVEALPRLRRPDDWGEYTLGMRKRFYREHGLPLRGKEPRRYTYCPQRALAYVRGKVLREIADIDAEAQTRIARLLREYDEAERRLRRGGEAEGTASDE